MNREALKLNDLLNIFDDISFSKETYSRLNELTLLRTECVKFYSKLCSTNLSIVYERKLKIVNFLNEISDTWQNENYDDDNYDDEDAYDAEMNDVYNLIFYTMELIE